MPQTNCPECGAKLPATGSCKDNFHALLALEWQVPGGAGTTAHFYAVSSYILQHPESMSYTVEALAWLRSSVTSVLAGEASTQGLRDSIHKGGKPGAKPADRPAGKVTRREGDPVQEWPVAIWTTNVCGILDAGTEDYAGRVQSWARSIIDDLDRNGA